jgi:hypothetical protein
MSSMRPTAPATAHCTLQRREDNTVVQLLVDSGAKLDVKNKRGQTPLALTLVRPKGGVEGQPRFKSTADLLRKLGATECSYGQLTIKKEPVQAPLHPPEC